MVLMNFDHVDFVGDSFICLCSLAWAVNSTPSLDLLFMINSCFCGKIFKSPIHKMVHFGEFLCWDLLGFFFFF